MGEITSQYLHCTPKKDSSFHRKEEGSTADVGGAGAFIPEEKNFRTILTKLTEY